VCGDGEGEEGDDMKSVRHLLKERFAGSEYEEFAAAVGEFIKQLEKFKEEESVRLHEARQRICGLEAEIEGLKAERDGLIAAATVSPADGLH